MFKYNAVYILKPVSMIFVDFICIILDAEIRHLNQRHIQIFRLETAIEY